MLARNLKKYHDKKKLTEDLCTLLERVGTSSHAFRQQQKYPLK